MIKPEQSKPMLGAEQPKLYRVPMSVSANATIRSGRTESVVLALLLSTVTGQLVSSAAFIASFPAGLQEIISISNIEHHIRILV